MTDRATHPVRRVIRASWPWIALALALALWTSGGPGGARIADGEPAPALTIPWTGGGQLDLAAERGHVVVLAFWATWCDACRREGPVLSRVHERIRGRGDRVIGVSVDPGSLDAIARAAVALGMRYPIGQGTRADTDRFAVELLPTIYVIDPRGRVASSHTGMASEEQLLEAVERARRRRASTGESGSRSIARLGN